MYNISGSMYKGESYHLGFAARKGRTILSGGYKAAICIGNTCRARDMFDGVESDLIRMSGLENGHALPRVLYRNITAGRP